MSLLRLTDITRTFGRTTILQGINLEVAADERIALRGPNGSGKTTLLRIAAGTLAPTAGKVERPTVGYLPQDAPCYRELSVVDHLRFASSMQGGSTDPHAAIEPLLAAGLEAHADRPAGTLSRGQRQRLGILMALAGEPDVLILDEPTTALDDMGRKWLIEQIQHCDASVLAAMHDSSFNATRTVTLSGGTLQ